MISNIKKNTKIAYDKGYRVSLTGEVFSPFRKEPIKTLALKGEHKYAKFTVKSDSGVRLNISVHHLVAYQKYGDEYLLSTDLVVRHLNGDRFDNSYHNIALGTQADNMLDVPKETRLRSGKHAASFLKSLTDEEVNQLRLDRDSGLSYAALMKKYGLAKSTVSYIVNHKTYK
jgi:hypothetical protein